VEYLVFVYGTLRRGCANHGLLQKGARLLGPGATREAHALYLDGDGVPYVKEAEGLYAIRGELYRVDDRTLAALDALEEHPDDYERRETAIVLDDGARHTAWLYFHPSPPGRLLPGGDFLA